MEDQLRLICFRVKATSGIKSHRSGKCDISICLTAFLVIGGHCCGDCTFQHLMNSFFLNKSLPVLEKITKQTIKSKKKLPLELWTQTDYIIDKWPVSFNRGNWIKHRLNPSPRHIFPTPELQSLPLTMCYCQNKI